MIEFFQATTARERQAIDTFLAEHNKLGKGSTKGYIAYYAARIQDSSLEPTLLAAAKFCPLHTPQAAKFFGGEDWTHVYVLQRLAAYQAPRNLLSEFLGWCLRMIGKDPKVWYVSTYADTGVFNPVTGHPHDGGIYRVTNAVYCGMSQGGRVSGYLLNGERRSLRCGPRTLKVSEIPPEAQLLRSSPKHRYCWAVGPWLKRQFRRKQLEARMAKYQFEPVHQPRLLIDLRSIYVWLKGGMTTWPDSRQNLSYCSTRPRWK